MSVFVNRDTHGVSMKRRTNDHFSGFAHAIARLDEADESLHRIISELLPFGFRRFFVEQRISVMDANRQRLSIYGGSIDGKQHNCRDYSTSGAH